MKPNSKSHQTSTLFRKARLAAILIPMYSAEETGRILSHLNEGNDEAMIKINEQFSRINDLEGEDLDKYRGKIKSYRTFLIDADAEMPDLIASLPANISRVIRTEVFHLPHHIATELKRHVIGQDHVVEEFSLAMYLHLLRTGQIDGIDKADLTLPRLVPFLVGSSGTGKTFIAETFSRLYDVPFLVFDASSLTSSGYHGNDISSMFSTFYQQGYSTERIEKAIIVLDEFDKLAVHQTGSSVEIRGKAVQHELLRLLDTKGGDIIFRESGGPGSSAHHKINTRQMTFVLAGACSGIDQYSQRRTQGGTLGFNKSPIQNPEITDQDLLAYGFIRELVGRISNVLQLSEMSEDTIVEILSASASSPLKEFESYFRLHGMDTSRFEDNAWLKTLAQRAIDLKLGARGVYKVLNKDLRQVMFTQTNI